MVFCNCSHEYLEFKYTQQSRVYNDMEDSEFTRKICNIINVDYFEDTISIETDIGVFKAVDNLESVQSLALTCLKLKGKGARILVGTQVENKDYFQSIEEYITEDVVPPLPRGKVFESQTSKKIFGPPGTGKTTTLIKFVEEAVRSGVSPNEIAFISFSNAAANVAKLKVANALPQFGAVDFPNFSTMHSLATRVGEQTGKVLMQEKDYKSFDPSIKTWKEWTELGNPLGTVDRFQHIILDAYSLSISRCEPMDFDVFNSAEQTFDEKLDRIAITVSHVLKKEAETIKAEIYSLDKSKQPSHLNALVSQYIEQFKLFKLKNNLISFDDVIEKVSAPEFPKSLLPTFEVLIIDEAQDLTSHLWLFAKKLIAGAKTAYIAGDDDQAIMIGIGATPETFVNLKTTDADDPLQNSHRIPLEVRKYVDRGVMPYLLEIPNRSGTTWLPNNKNGYVESGFQTTEEDEKGTKTVLNHEFEPKKLIKRVQEDYLRSLSKDFGERLFYAEEGKKLLLTILREDNQSKMAADRIIEVAAKSLAESDIRKLLEKVGKGEIYSEDVFSSVGLELSIPTREYVPKNYEPNTIADWLIMAPTKRTGEKISDALTELKVPHFHRNRNVLEADTNFVNIRVQTVHMSKGDQARNTAVVAERVGDVLMLSKDPRLAYVALTRGSEVTYPRVVPQGLLSWMIHDSKVVRFSIAASRYNQMFPIGR